jgi:hypothetical protein
MRIRCLRLLVLLDLRSSPTVLSTLLLFALSKPWQAHQKNTTLYYASGIPDAQDSYSTSHRDG